MLALPLALALALVSGTPPEQGAPPKSARRAAERSARPIPAADEPVEEPGRLLVEAKCGKCHGLERTHASVLSDDGWKAHLRRMGKLPGAAITDEQAKVIHEYLRKTAPAPRP